MGPAVRGVENVLAAVNRTPTVKRVVMTSSLAAIYCDLDERGLDHTFTEADWNVRAGSELARVRVAADPMHQCPADQRPRGPHVVQPQQEAGRAKGVGDRGSAGPLGSCHDQPECRHRAAAGLPCGLRDRLYVCQAAQGEILASKSACLALPCSHGGDGRSELSCSVATYAGHLPRRSGCRPWTSWTWLPPTASPWSRHQQRQEGSGIALRLCLLRTTMTAPLHLERHGRDGTLSAPRPFPSRSSGGPSSHTFRGTGCQGPRRRFGSSRSWRRLPGYRGTCSRRTTCLSGGGA